MFASLRELAAVDRNGLTYPVLSEGNRVASLLDYLGVPRDVPLIIILVNGRRGSEDTVLHDGDRIGIFSPVGGG